MDWGIAAIALLGAVEAGWMAFDGTRALVAGDYVTPRRGAHAGQLGPWARLVRAVGIDPRSTLMKSLFAAYGTVWLVVIGCFIFQAPGSREAMLAAAIGALWFAPVGTACSLAQIALLVR